MTHKAIFFVLSPKDSQLSVNQRNYNSSTGDKKFIVMFYVRSIQTATCSVMNNWHSLYWNIMYTKGLFEFGMPSHFLKATRDKNVGLFEFHHSGDLHINKKSALFISYCTWNFIVPKQRMHRIFAKRPGGKRSQHGAATLRTLALRSLYEYSVRSLFW